MSAKIDAILRNQSGVALVIALIMMIVITLIALASSYTSIYEMRISGNKRGATDAFYSADGTINAIMAYPNQNFTVTNYLSTNNPPYTFNPFSNSTLYPTSVTNSVLQSGSNTTNTNTYITYYNGVTSPPPRGGGYSAVNMSYTYFNVQCVGIDSAGSGASSTVQEDVIRLSPVQ